MKTNWSLLMKRLYAEVLCCCTKAALSSRNSSISCWPTSHLDLGLSHDCTRYEDSSLQRGRGWGSSAQTQELQEKRNDLTWFGFWQAGFFSLWEQNRQNCWAKASASRTEAAEHQHIFQSFVQNLQLHIKATKMSFSAVLSATIQIHLVVSCWKKSDLLLWCRLANEAILLGIHVVLVTVCLDCLSTSLLPT